MTVLHPVSNALLDDMKTTAPKRPSRYFQLEEDRRNQIKDRAKMRYRADPDRHRLKRYLHALNAGKVLCPKPETLQRHSIRLVEDGWVSA